MNSAIPKVLIVDDDIQLCELLSEYLRIEGIETDSVNCAQDALERLDQQNNHNNNYDKSQNKGYDIVVLDIMMPDMSGLELLQQLRLKNSIPIIMLTGRGDDIDRILGLEMGADDYLGKPCNPRELLARIRTVLRRTNFADKSPNVTTLCLHEITLDTGNLVAQVKGKSLKLTSAEFSILEMLMRCVGQVISKEELTQRALHRELERYDRSIDVHISRLRKKLSSHDVNDIIKSIRGMGYQLIVER